MRTWPPNSPQAKALELQRVLEAIETINTCLPTSSGVQAATAGLVNACTDFNMALSVFALQLDTAICWLGSGAAGDDCYRPLLGCDHFIVANGLVDANALYIYDTFAKGFIFPTIVSSNSDLNFQQYSSTGGAPTPMAFLTDIQLPVWATIAGTIYCQFHYNLLTFNAPVLTTVGVDFDVAANQSLENLNIPLLATVGRDLVIGAMLLTIPSAPSLRSVGRNISCGGDIVQDVNFPALVSFNGDFDCSVSALTAAGVNHILEMLDALGVTGHTITLNGGTSATPTGAGLTAKANLEGRGCTVLVN